MPFTSITNRKSTAKNAANNENVQALDDLRSAIIEAAARGEKYHGPVTAAAEKVQPNALQQQQIRASIIEAALKGTDKKPDLEADPYWDMSKIPSHTFKAKEPHVGKIVSVKRIVGPTAIGEICEIVIGHGGKMPYWEGQSYGIIPPGINEKNGKPHNPRLYSIASTRYGDDGTGTTTTFTVRRAAYFCPELKAEDPAKKGVCSNFLCDSKPGTPVTLIGPSGKVMLIPEKDPNADIIMVATGTGIAPFR
jgi:ferredoxin--NADP+ reductase